MRIIFSALIKEEKEGGYSVLCPELGVASQGETIYYYTTASVFRMKNRFFELLEK